MDDWFYELDGDRHGPIEADTLRQLIESGSVAPEVLIWKEGMTDWLAANMVAEFKVPPPLPSQAASTNSSGAGYIDRFRVWFTNLSFGGKAGVIACGIFVLSIFSSSSTSQVDDGNTQANSSTDADSDRDLSLGDEFQLGDFKYRVLSSANRRTVGNQFMRERADNGAIFVIVSYSLENCTKETQTVLADDMKLVDAEGRTFDPSSKANTALLAEDGKDFLLSELQPGIARTMKTAFELPLSSLNGDITLVVPEKGMFSSGKKRVRIK